MALLSALWGCDEREGGLAPEHVFVAATVVDGKTFVTDEGDTLTAVNAATMPRYTGMQRAYISYDLLDRAVGAGDALPMLLSDQMGYNEIPTFDAPTLPEGLLSERLCHLASNADKAYVAAGFLNIFPEMLRDDEVTFACALRLDSLLINQAFLTVLYNDRTDTPDYLWHGQVSLRLPHELLHHFAPLTPSTEVTLHVSALTEHGQETLNIEVAAKKLNVRD